MTTTVQALDFYTVDRPTIAAHWRALSAIIRREWIVFKRYPSWIIALVIWPIIFPAAYILSARALAGPDGSGLAVFNTLYYFYATPWRARRAIAKSRA